MKKIFMLLTSLLLIIMVAGCGGGGEKKMVIGLDDNFAPMGFRNEKNELVGYDIDMAKEACKRAGLEVTFKPIDWSSKEAELNGKRIDALWNCLSVTPAREKVIKFSRPYMNNRQIIVVPVNSKIQTLADLKGKVLAVQDNSTGADRVEEYPDVKKGLKDYRKYPDFAAAFLDIDSGRVDALVVDEILARYYMVKKPGKYRVLKDDMGAEVVAVGFRKDDQERCDKINKAMEEMLKDGTAKKISEKWFGADVTKY